MTTIYRDGKPIHNPIDAWFTYRYRTVKHLPELIYIWWLPIKHGETVWNVKHYWTSTFWWDVTDVLLWLLKKLPTYKYVCASIATQLTLGRTDKDEQSRQIWDDFCKKFDELK